MRLLSIWVMCMSMAMLALASGARLSNADLEKQVAATERAFAATMRARDHAAFSAFLAEEAVFMAGSATLRGRDAVVQAWQPCFTGAEAPFSWEPGRVVVVDSGTLAYTAGPVRNADGHVVGRFDSVWRLEAPGRWKIVFDRGGPPPCH